MTLTATPARLGILVSGRGSNFLAIHHAIATAQLPNAQIACVLSNRPDAPALAAARERSLPAIPVPANGRSRSEQDAEIVHHLRAHRADLVCLAGYMRLLSPGFLAAYPNRVLNIHPSLLPSFPGLDAQSQAFAYGVQVAGCTVHFVDEQLDHGVIILQRAVPVEPADTPETLAARILAQEHQLYPEAIARVLSGDYRVEGRRYVRSHSASGA